ncbi:uncharacterized protein AB675_2375 [Cyphellophora attinorum]|uniref:F-box domain-containing protein n=1 Tax=Cyphellophora attinorum TaxID=1664694 RepID=A0A0N0NRK0_9EURO|nr:uncharacterized protein AB675_2375 [Phialophora attinorum]KPI44939.1 hypothetical protein AB675_2375 [Phialophora attinorum]
MALLTLPNEALVPILELLHWKDFESFAVSCKSAYTASSPLLARHNAARRQYYKIVGSPESVLDLVSQDPYIAPLITHLNLDCWNLDNWSDDAGEESTLLLLSAPSMSINTLSTMIDSSEHIKRLADSAKWTTHLLTGEKSEAARDAEVDVDTEQAPCDSGFCWTAFLLSLLPNLQTLILPADWLPELQDPTSKGYPDNAEIYDRDRIDCVCFVSEMMLQLVTRAGDATLRGQPLAKLLTLGQRPEPDQCGVDCTPLLPFLSLPSLRNIYHYAGVMYLDNDTGLGSLYKPIGRNLESTEFCDFAASADSMKAMFGNANNLRVVKIGYRMKDEVCCEYAVRDLVDTLGEAAGHSLEVLSLTLGYDFALWEMYPAIRNLDSFTRLREVEFDTSLFYFWESPQNESPFHQLPCGFLPSEDAQAEVDSGHSLDEGQTEKDYSRDRGQTDGETIFNGGHLEEDPIPIRAQFKEDPIPDRRQTDEATGEGVDDNSSQASTEEDSDDDEESPEGCPRLSRLLYSSFATIEKITLRVPALQADMICLERLLRDIDLHSDHEIFPKLQSIKVYICDSDHWDHNIGGARNDLIGHAQAWLTEKGIDVEHFTAHPGERQWPAGDFWSRMTA